MTGGSRRTMTLAAALGAVLVAAGLVETTQAGFTAGFDGSISASGSIDIAQAEGQFADAGAPNVLEPNGLPIRPAETTDGWPTRPTAAVSMTFVNLAPSAVVDARLIVRERTPSGLLPHLVVGARVGDETAGPMSGERIADEGLPLPVRLAPGDETGLDVHVWLADDAPADALARPVELVLRIVGETRAGEPIVIKGVWR